jgi:hypothetical protein
MSNANSRGHRKTGQVPARSRWGGAESAPACYFLKVLMIFPDASDR